MELTSEATTGRGQGGREGREPEVNGKPKESDLESRDGNRDEIGGGGVESAQPIAGADSLRSQRSSVVMSLKW